jgi:lipopolysaccharide exporter
LAGIAQFRNKLKSLSGDKKSVLALVGGTTIAQGLNFIFSPIQTRLFSPEVFGELSVFTSITGIIGIIICLGYDQGIVLPKDDDEGFSILKLAWLFATIISTVSLIIFGFFNKQIYSWFNAFALAKYWYYVPITLLLTGLIQASNYWLIRKEKFTILSYNKVIPVLALNLVSIGLGFVGNKALGARLFSILISSVFNIAILLSVIIPDLKVKERIKYKKIDLIKKYKNFLLYDIWSNLINNLSWMLVPILLNSYFGSFVAGQYSVSLKVIQLPASIIGASIGQVFLKTASQKRHTNELYSYTILMIRKMFLYTLPFAVILALFGKVLFAFVFGEQWATAGLYTQILALWAVVWFVASPISAVVVILQKQKISLITSIANLFLRVISLLIGKYLSNPIIGLISFSFSGFFVSILSILICIYIVKKDSK